MKDQLKSDPSELTFGQKLEIEKFRAKADNHEKLLDSYLTSTEFPCRDVFLARDGINQKNVNLKHV